MKKSRTLATSLFLGLALCGSLCGKDLVRSAGDPRIVCVVRDGSRYLMMHSPANGMRLKESTDCRTWKDLPGEIVLGQRTWPWAHGRLTAGFLLDARKVAGIGKWVLFFHGSGPKAESEGDFDRNASIGLAVSDDFTAWTW